MSIKTIDKIAALLTAAVLLAGAWFNRAEAQISGPPYNPKHVAITGGSISGLSALNANAVIGGNGLDTTSFRMRETTNATVAGTSPVYDMYAAAHGGLHAYFVDMLGGTRLWLWSPSTAVPNIPHTGIAPTVAVYGDVLIGDIAALGSSAMTYFMRSELNLDPNVAITQFFSARNVNNDTDGGSGFIMAPAKNGGGAVNDGYLDFVAYGLGSGSLANSVMFSTRQSSGVSTRRWQINGQSASKGDFQPVADNAYNIGAAGARVATVYSAGVNLGDTTLSSYKEGTFTPSVSFGGACTGCAYSVQVGTYTRIGNTVHVQGQIVLTNKGSSVGAFQIAGLPLAASATAGNYSVVNFRFNNFAATVAGAPTGRVDLGATTMSPEFFTAGTVTGMTDAHVQNNSSMVFSATYGL